MKNALFVILALSIAGGASVPAHAQQRPGNSELGIFVGEPTGFSAKFWSGNHSAINVGIAWSFSDQGFMLLQADLVHHTTLDSPELAIYYGLGARLLMKRDPVTGIRIPGGLQYMIPESNLVLFFELAPVFDLNQDSSFGLNGGLGLRYFF